MDFSTVKSLLFTFAPFLISYGLSYYRSLKAQSQSSRRLRQPVPPHVRTALVLLAGAAACCFIIGLPLFAQENVISATSSRLQTPSDVLWRRVASMRPEGKLTPFDERLTARFNTTKARLLYLKYGPETVTECPFCFADDPMTYLIYALPTLVLPHLANIAVLGIATSNFLSGAEGNRWRTQAVLAGSIFAAVDVYAFYSYDHTRNGLALRGQDLSNFYWVMRAARYYGICAVNSAFAALLWASSTNRMFVAPVTSGDKVQQIAQQLQVTSGKMAAANILRNTTLRDDASRRIQTEYWAREAEFMRDIMADEEVNRSVTTAVNSGRLDLRRVEHDAGAYSEGLLQSVVQNEQDSRQI